MVSRLCLALSLVALQMYFYYLYNVKLIHTSFYFFFFFFSFLFLPHSSGLEMCEISHSLSNCVLKSWLTFHFFGQK